MYFKFLPIIKQDGISTKFTLLIANVKDLEQEKNPPHLVRTRPSCLAQAQCWDAHQPGALRPGADHLVRRVLRQLRPHAVNQTDNLRLQ